MSNSVDTKVFLQMSELLTGYDGLDEDLIPTFLEHITDEVALAALLAGYQALPQPPDMNTFLEFLEKNEGLLALARKITLLWYTGTTYLSTDDNPKYALPSYIPVSEDAYLGGIAWKIMEGHPQGQCGGEFGYWSTVPSDN